MLEYTIESPGNKKTGNLKIWVTVVAVVLIIVLLVFKNFNVIKNSFSDKKKATSQLDNPDAGLIQINEKSITGNQIQAETITGNNITKDTLEVIHFKKELIFPNATLFDMSAVNHLTEINQGLVIPNVTSGSPAKPNSGRGHIAFNTKDNQLLIYDGTNWIPIAINNYFNTTNATSSPTVLAQPSNLTGIFGGKGLGGGGTQGDITLDINTGEGLRAEEDTLELDLTYSGNTSKTESNSGMELNDEGLSLIRGCDDNETLSWDNDEEKWKCFTQEQAESISVIAGDGLVGTSLDNEITLDIALSQTGTTSSSTSNSGLEITAGGIRLLGGCGSNQVLAWDSVLETWECTSIAGVGTISGAGTDGQVTFWDGVSSITGSNDFYWDDSTSRLGLGILAPQYTLDVDGSARIASGSDLYIGSVNLGAAGSSNSTSGASLIGAFDEFSYSSSTNVQDVLDDLDSQMTTINSAIGTTHPSLTHSAGSTTYISLNVGTQVLTTNAIDLSNSANTSGVLSAARGGLGIDSSTAPTGTLLISTGSGFNIKPMGGDATIDSTGTLTLANSGVGAGTYGSALGLPVITVDSKGRLTSASTAPFLNILDGSGNTNFISKFSDSNTLAVSGIYENATGVGIGTQAPWGVFDVRGAIRLGTNSTQGNSLNSSPSSSAPSSSLYWGSRTLLDDTNAGNYISTALSSTNAGISLSSSTGPVTFTLDATTSGATSTTAAGSGLEIASDGIRLIGGCSSNQVLAWDSGANRWQCTSVGLGNVTGNGVATRIAFWNGGTSLASSQDLYWDNVNGRLGVGTSSPSVKLDISGQLAVSSTASLNGSLVLANSPTGTTDSVLVLNSGNQVGTRTIDAKVWGSTLIDSSSTHPALQLAGTPNYLSLNGTQVLTQSAIDLSNSNNISNQLITSSGGLGIDTSTAPSGTLIISTGSGFNIKPLGGDATISSSGTLTLANSGVSASTYGSSLGIPILTIDAKGRVTSASTASISYEVPLTFSSGLTRTVNTIVVDATTSGTTSTTASNSGLEIAPDGISIVRGCANSEILKWNAPANVWYCATDSVSSSGLSTIKENDSNVVTSATVIDFLGNDFSVTDSPTGEGNVSIDYTNSKITRSDQNEVITGNWAFTPSSTNVMDINLDADSFINIDQTFSGSTSTNSITDTMTNNSSSGTQNGIYLDNAPSTGSTEAFIVLDNSDTDTAVGAGIKIIDAGGGITNVIDNNGTLISSSELNILDGGIALSDLTDSGTLTASIVDINSGTIDGTTIGGSSAAPGTFITLTSSGALDANAASTISSLTLDANTGTGLSISGTSFSTDISFQNGETLDNDSDSQLNFKSNADTTITLLGSDSVNSNTPLTLSSSGTGTLTIDPTGAGGIVLGSADVTSITFTTDDNNASDFSFTGGLTANGAFAMGGALSGVTTLNSSGDWTWTTSTPSITINSSETLSIGPSGGDTFTINSSGSSFGFTDGSNAYSFDVDSNTGPVYSGTARPIRQVTLTPEFPGAVLTGSGDGIMTSDFCEQGFNADVTDTNTTDCESGQIHNYYYWTAASGSQTYSIYIRWRVPDNFDSQGWTSSGQGISTPIKVYARRSDSSDGTVTTTLYDTAGSAENTTSGTQVAGSNSTWTQTSLESTPFEGTYTAGSYMTLKIDLQVTGTDNVQVGEIDIEYLSKN